MSMRVHKSTSNDDMVKPLLTRKSRQFQTAVERWSTLRQSSSRSFDRLNLRNKFEDERLLRKHRDLSDLSEAQLKEVFRVKDEMRVALIDIAKSKRQGNTRESDFESRLRDGKHSPIFQMEYRRLKRKQLELGKLSEQLKGPNSKLLASNLTTELKNVEMKSLKEVTRRESKYKGKWLAPLKALPKSVPAHSGEGDTEGTPQVAKSPGTDFANLVQLVHKQFKKASISGTSKDTPLMPSIKNDNTTSISELGKSAPNVLKADHDLNSKAPLKTNDDVLHRDEAEAGQQSGSRHPKTKLIPIASAISLLDTPVTENTEPAVEVKRKKRQRKDTEQSLPTVPEAHESPSPRDPEAAAPPKPKARKNRKQKARALFMKGMQTKNASDDKQVSRTESARHRDRLMKKRLSDLAAKTKDDIANRRSVSPHDEALNSIYQVEVVARLQLARSKVGITLPEVRKNKKAHSDARRSSKGQTAISLPPVNVEGKLLRELKEQRRKHRNQSTGLPKLP